MYSLQLELLLPQGLFANILELVQFQPLLKLFLKQSLLLRLLLLSTELGQALLLQLELLLVQIFSLQMLLLLYKQLRLCTQSFLPT